MSRLGRSGKFPSPHPKSFVRVLTYHLQRKTSQNHNIIQAVKTIKTQHRRMERRITVTDCIGYKIKNISDPYLIYVSQSFHSLCKGSSTREALSVFVCECKRGQCIYMTWSIERVVTAESLPGPNPNAVGTRVPAKPLLRMHAELDPLPEGGRQGGIHTARVCGGPQ